MLLVFILFYVLAHIAPPVAIAVQVMAMCSLHPLVTLFLILCFA